MAKVASNKVSKTELKNIKEAQEAFDGTMSSIGALEYRKSMVMNAMMNGIDMQPIVFCVKPI
jgi:hypothetical protein